MSGFRTLLTPKFLPQLISKIRTMIFRRVLVMPRIIISSSKTQIEIHPAALDAHLWASDLKRQFERTALPAPLLSALAKQPLQCINTDDKRLLLFAPLCTAFLWQGAQPPDKTPIICYTQKEISEEDVFKTAWASVLGEIFNSLHPTVLPDLRDSLSEKLPEHLHRAFFMSKTFSDSLLCTLTGMARSTLTDQRKAKKPTSKATVNSSEELSVESVLQQLLQPRNKK